MKRTTGKVAILASACFLTMWLPFLAIAIGLGVLGGLRAAIGLPVAGVLIAGGALVAVALYRWWRRLEVPSPSDAEREGMAPVVVAKPQNMSKTVVQTPKVTSGEGRQNDG